MYLFKYKTILFTLGSTASVNFTTKLLFRIREITLPLYKCLFLGKYQSNRLQVLSLPVIEKMLSDWATTEGKVSSVGQQLTNKTNALQSQAEHTAENPCTTTPQEWFHRPTPLAHTCLQSCDRHDTTGLTHVKCYMWLAVEVLLLIDLSNSHAKAVMPKPFILRALTKTSITSLHSQRVKYPQCFVSDSVLQILPHSSMQQWKEYRKLRTGEC